MVIIITGASCCGKTKLSQSLLEKYHFPYLSIDHLKMGLIRSKQTTLTPYDDDKLVDYLWNIVKEIIKTAIENNQNLIIEGCYIPFDYQNYFTPSYLKDIKYLCLIMSENYINNHFDEIKNHANDIEKRLYQEFDKQTLINDNNYFLKNCIKYNLNYHLFDLEYDVNKIKSMRD